jgi:hypothetical protein
MSAHPPHQLHEDGLHLIILGMSHSQPPRSHFLRHPAEEAIPHLPSRFLQREMMPRLKSSYISSLNGDGQAQFGRQLGNIFGIGIGFHTPQHVIQVNQVKLYSQSLPQCYQDVKKADRIWTAGYSH